MKRLLISFAIFLFAWLPVFFIGLFATFVLLWTTWNGKSTWFGNVLYGREGNAHTPPNPSRADSYGFLALRNPISNFGKFTLSRRSDNPDAWLEEKRSGRFSILYGWKNEDPRLPGTRAFVFRPRIEWRR